MVSSKWALHPSKMILSERGVESFRTWTVWTVKGVNASNLQSTGFASNDTVQSMPEDEHKGSVGLR
jgi:hypothetical protein